MSNILLVEDNEMNRDMLSRRLKRKGFDVFLAEDGLVAVEKASSCSPSLILMDVSLPGIDGLEATKQIKRNPLTAHIPVIALTAHAMDGDRERCLSAGCNDYETKPIDLERLLAKMKALIAPD